MSNAKGKNERKVEGHVLTEKEAVSLLLTMDTYFEKSLIEPHSNGRHRTVVVAEAMERAGLFDLASGAMEIHNDMEAFRKGSLKALRTFQENPQVDNFLELAKGTRFEKEAKTLGNDVSHIEDILHKHGGIDWGKSSEVLARPYGHEIAGVGSLRPFAHATEGLRCFLDTRSPTPTGTGSRT